MHIPKRALMAAVPVVAAGLVAGALAAPSAKASQARPAGKVKAQAIHILIKDVTESDGSGPAFVGPGGVGAKTLFTAKVGRPVVITIVNKSTTLHSFTAQSLGLNSIIMVGKTTVVKFTPKKAGLIPFLCTPPCGEWVMATDGYMKGYIKVTK